MPYVRIYTLAGCPYCAQAKKLLTDKGVTFEEIDATGDEPMRTWLRQVTGKSTLPQTFVNRRSLGGASDLVALEETGELNAILGLY